MLRPAFDLATDDCRLAACTSHYLCCNYHHFIHQRQISAQRKTQHSWLPAFINLSAVMKLFPHEQADLEKRLTLAQHLSHNVINLDSLCTSGTTATAVSVCLSLACVRPTFSCQGNLRPGPAYSCLLRPTVLFCPVLAHLVLAHLFYPSLQPGL